jgi:soluble lytic murein transglycosylase-like protein
MWQLFQLLIVEVWLSGAKAGHLQGVTLAMVAVTLLLAILGHPKLGLFNQDESDNNSSRSLDGLKVSALASILSNYTDKTDAVKTARRYQVHTDDPELWTAMTIVESRCNSAAVSTSGAQGKLQVMPFWKRAPGFEFYRGKYSHLDDNLNFKAAHKVYKMLLSEHKGNKWLAVERYCGVGHDAKVYAAEVKQLYSRIKSATNQIVRRNPA